MNIVVLMGSPDIDFEEKHGFPKMLYEINAVPLIQRFMESCKSLFDDADEVTFVIRKEHNKKYYLGNIIKLLFSESKILELEGDTQGAACSTLMAIEYINSEEELFVISGDEIVDLDLSEVRRFFAKSRADGGVVTFHSVHPRFSYVRCTDDNIVTEAAEKRPISNNATVGYYYFAKGSDCIDSIEKMIIKETTVNGLYYLCPSYNEMILNGKEIKAYPIDKRDYHPLKSEETIKEYGRFLEEK